MGCSPLQQEILKVYEQREADGRLPLCDLQNLDKVTLHYLSEQLLILHSNSPLQISSPLTTSIYHLVPQNYQYTAPHTSLQTENSLYSSLNSCRLGK